MTGSLRTHGNGAISILSYRVTLSPEVQSGRPGIEFTERRGCSSPVERDGEFTVYRPNRQPIPSVRSYIRIDADDPRARCGSRARTELYSSTHPVGRDSSCPLFSDARRCRRPGLTYLRSL